MNAEQNFQVAYQSVAPNGHAGATAKIEVRCAANVEPEEVTWLWDSRVPYGKVTIWDGDPGQGKSVVSLAVAANVTTGRSFPDGAPCDTGNVLIVNVEDGEADTIVPRLKANGADLERAFMFSNVPDGRGGTRLLSLPEDTPLLEQLVGDLEARLVIIDPVMTMLGADANKDQDARKALAPLKELAERTGAAIVCIRHLNKTVGLKAIQRGGGNMGLIGVARAGAFFAPHPDDDDLMVIAQHKSNLAPKPASLAYQIVTSAINNAPRIEWKGTVEHDADSLASGPQSPEDRSQLDAAKEFLVDELGDGPMTAKQVLKDSQEAGVSRATLYRAKDALRVKSSKDGLGPWVWSLPDKPDRNAKRPEDVPHENLENLEYLENLQGTPPHPNGLKTPYLVEDTQGTQDTQDTQDTQASKNGRVSLKPSPARPETCIHSHPGGKGCYLCDPAHPSRAGIPDKGNAGKGGAA